MGGTADLSASAGLEGVDYLWTNSEVNDILVIHHLGVGATALH
ncbi:hypothetical protein BJ994_001269 [Arthrobacter pigmenti]|uniref:Uncharacterized protein n=1 Tax=Arthrobacter pigmenti TaxID=271432 RepID=A0A846RGD9_9MICC|nr:hypothetical protein [Arthrobacter pigmenti]